MMQRRLGWVLVVGTVLISTVACATSSGGGKANVVGAPSAAVGADQVEVYGPGQQMPDVATYLTVVEYEREVGLDAESVNKAVAEMRAEAAKLGCDAVLVLSYDIARSAKQGQSGQVATGDSFTAAGGNMNTVELRELKVVGVRWKEPKGQ